MAGGVYWAYAVAESQDEGYVLRFDGKELSVTETVRVGLLPAETEAPHGVAVSPEGAYWYASLAHGAPRGYLRRFETGRNVATGQVELDMFPSSLTVDRRGLFVYVANSNFHGDMVPSSISVVFAPEMIETARIETCTMPHGSRLNTSGSHHYSTCMMDDQLVEIDVARMAVSRRFALSPGAEAVLAPDDRGVHARSTHGMEGHGEQHGPSPSQGVPVCSPTWVQPSPDDRYAYVACNRSEEVLTVDLQEQRVIRRLRVPERPYNVDVTPDGRTLVVTHRKDPGLVTIWSTETWEKLASLETGRSHAHGIALTPDARFAFVTAEGVRGQSGTVDVLDTAAGVLVDRVHVGRQVAGISFWRMEGGSAAPPGGSREER